MNIITLTDPDDPRLEVYRLARDATALRRHGAFIAEGRTVVELLLSPGSLYEPRSLLVEAERLESLAPLLDAAPQRLPVYALPGERTTELMGFRFHRGVLAAGKAAEPRPIEPILAERHDLLLALEGVNNHDNLGAAFRHAAAFGAGAVLLDPRSADPLYRKSIRVSMGHVLRVPHARGETSRRLNERLAAAGYQVLALTPDPSAPPLRDVCGSGELGERVCVLVGAEGPGLSAAAQRSAAQRVRLPMAPGVDSLNLATAAAIALYEVRLALRARA